MNSYELTTDFNAFYEEFLSQIRPPVIDSRDSVVLKVLLYYVWRGASETRLTIIHFPKIAGKKKKPITINMYDLVEIFFTRAPLLFKVRADIKLS